MNPFLVCIVAFGTCHWAGKRSVGHGVVALLFWGYFYGIVRANMPTMFSHFIFDCALLGLYFAQKKAFTGEGDGGRTRVLRGWTWALMLWPVLLVLLPFQTVMISLVGLRGAVFFLPMLLLGGRLQKSDLTLLSNGLVVLNLLVLGFATAEYFLGVPQFYPSNAVTVIIYSSVDVAGGLYRIPGTFANAHTYGGAMVGSIPFLAGGWHEGKTRKARQFALIGITAALLGVLMSATRQNFIVAAALVVVTVLMGRMKTTSRVIFVALIGIMLLVATSNERFARFKTLADTGYVGERVHGSVNRGFFEILMEYPMGNGLGGGGTSIPFFLEGQVRNPVVMENEYARMLSEQGFIGLMLWLVFIAWYLSNTRSIFGKTTWATSRRLVWCLSLLDLLIGLIGLGMLTSIPGTAMMLLGMGWTAVPMAAETNERRPLRLRRPMVPQPRFSPAHTI